MLLCEGSKDVFLCGSAGIVKQTLEEVGQVGMIHGVVSLFDALLWG